VPTIVGIGDSLMLLDNFLGPFANRQGWTATNKGVSGEVTTQIAARFAADVVALAPDYVLINGGINDIGLGTVTHAQFLINWDAMLASAQSHNIIPIVMLITPRSTSNTDQQATDTDTWNEDLRALIRAGTYRDVTHVINIRPWVGVPRGTGPVGNFWDYRTCYSADGVHLNAYGSVVAGLVIQHDFLDLVGSP
jgi:lysophospholipase L1-like esterase